MHYMQSAVSFQAGYYMQSVVDYIALQASIVVSNAYICDAITMSNTPRGWQYVLYEKPLVLSYSNMPQRDDQQSRSCELFLAKKSLPTRVFLLHGASLPTSTKVGE